MSCQEEISSRFTHAIKQNNCPFCGDPIVAEALQKVLNSLREVMTEAVSQDFEADAFEWLNANYELVSKNSEEYFKLQLELEATKKELVELQEKYAKPVPRSGKAQPRIDKEQMGTDEEGHVVQVQGESIQDPEMTQTFLNRAQVRPLNNQDHFKEMVKKIKKNNSGGSVGGGGEVSMESLAQASPEAIEEMESMLNSGIPNISSALDHGNNDFEDELPPIVEQFVNGGNNKNQQAGGYNAKDVAALQKMLAKSQRAGREINNSGGAGLIRR